jgi:chaperonin GroES
MKFRPLHDKVLVKRTETTEQRRGGIIIPDTAQEEPQMGEVLEVGPGRVTKGGRRQPLDVNVGEMVYFSTYAGTEISIGGQDL